MESRAQFVGWQLGPSASLTLTVHDHTRDTEHGDHAGDTEELGPPHDHVRYGFDGHLDDTL